MSAAPSHVKDIVERQQIHSSPWFFVEPGRPIHSWKFHKDGVCYFGSLITRSPVKRQLANFDIFDSDWLTFPLIIINSNYFLRPPASEVLLNKEKWNFIRLSRPQFSLNVHANDDAQQNTILDVTFWVQQERASPFIERCMLLKGIETVERYGKSMAKAMLYTRHAAEMADGRTFFFMRRYTSVQIHSMAVVPKVEVN